jgi:hypothetical protein
LNDQRAVFVENFLYLESHLAPYDPLEHSIMFNRIDDTTVGYQNIYVRHEQGTIKVMEVEVTLDSSLWTVPTFESKNECFLATLESLDTWKELEPWRYIETEDGYAFDLLFLVKLITNQLNEIKCGNPFPLRPFNPFTGEPFSKAFLNRTYERLVLNTVRTCLMLRLYLSGVMLREEFKNQYDRVEFFQSQGLRYVYQFGFGYWDLASTPPSFVEEFILPVIQMMAGQVDVNEVVLYEAPYLLPESYYYILV